MNIFYFMAQQTMLFSIPLLVVAIGAMFSERSGVWNISLEGTMIIGGFCGILLLNALQDRISGQLLLVCAVVVSMLAGAVYSVALSVAAIHLKANQTIAGTALNMFAPAFAIYAARMIRGVQQIPFQNTFRIAKVPLLGDIPFLGPMLFQNAYLTTYLGIGIMIASTVVLYKTKYGLRVRACGEHPHAADSVGINVYRIRYSGVCISGALAGLGGLVFIVPNSTEFRASVAGYGFLAMAVLIFGQWTPGGILRSSLLFGFMKTVSSAYGAIPVLAALQIPTYYYKITPYVVTLIVLAFTSKNSQAPVASGIPYDKGAR